MATTDQIKALYRGRFDAFLRFAYRELHPNQPLIDMVANFGGLVEQ